MEKKLNVGDNVLVFENYKYISPFEILPFINGTVVECRESDDLSYHGSPWYVYLYKVIGEDGNTYLGSYRSSIIGNAYYYKVEDYIEYLKYIKEHNENEILELTQKNQSIDELIESMKEKQLKLQT